MSSAIQLLTPDENLIPSVADKIWTPSICATVAFAGTCIVKWGTRRPVFSGIQTHAIATSLAFAAGMWLDKHRNAYLAERDAVLRRYVELHPEDFPDPERKKFAEILLPWQPVR